MGSFVLFAAVLGLLAVGFAVVALWRESRGLAVTLAIALPLAAAGLYWLKGEPAALDPKNLAAPTTIEEAVDQLQRRVAAEPENLEGLVLLARSYMAVEKFELARDAYAKAMKLDPGNGDLSVEYAESLLRASPDRHFPPEAVALIESAVAKNPRNQRALFFLGLQRLQDKRPAEAAAAWEQLLPLLDARTAAALRPQLDSARSAAGLPPLPVAAVSEAGLDIEVRIEPALAPSVKPGDVLYVFARAPDGAGPPFAAKRIVLGALPMQVRLSDADSPMPAALLSSQKSVLLNARISRSGDVQPGSGDLEADPMPADTAGKSPITLTLTRKRP